MVHTVLLVNPAAGGGTAAKVAGSVADTLRAGSDRLDAVTATDLDTATELARRAVQRGANVLAVLGGDGTMHAALQACAGTDTGLAMIPAGCGNDFAAALGLPTDPLSAARGIADALPGGRRRRLDLGRIAGGDWFATVLCAGFDGAVNERANRLRWPAGPRRYDLAVVRELLNLRPRPLTVDVADGRLELDATMVAIGNTAYYGGGIPVCPDADPTDGLLDITVVGAVTRRQIAAMLPTLRTGRHIEHPRVTTLRARSVHLGGDTGWISYADGERQARLPLTVTCLPRATSVIIPVDATPFTGSGSDQPDGVKA